MSDYIYCEICGGKYTKPNKSRHFKTERHIFCLNLQNRIKELESKLNTNEIKHTIVLEKPIENLLEKPIKNVSPPKNPVAKSVLVPTDSKVKQKIIDIVLDINVLVNESFSAMKSKNIIKTLECFNDLQKQYLELDKIINLNNIRLSSYSLKDGIISINRYWIMKREKILDLLDNYINNHNRNECLKRIDKIKDKTLYSKIDNPISIDENEEQIKTQFNELNTFFKGMIKETLIEQIEDRLNQITKLREKIEIYKTLEQEEKDYMLRQISNITNNINTFKRRDASSLIKTI